MIQFTKQEERILNVLADGKPHSVEELLNYIDDNLSLKGAVVAAIVRIRAKLKPHGQYIHCIESRDGTSSAYIHTTKSTVLIRS